MALPSSPPLLPEPDLPSSPAQLQPSSYLAIDSSSRKRHLSEYSSLSSDPLFSEDISEAETYSDNNRTKRKRLVRGPWWRLAQKRAVGSSTESLNGQNVRNLDSGVFMGSDLSEDSIDRVVTMQSACRSPDKKEWPYKASNKAVASQALPAAELIVHECVETGTESVDLSDLGMEHLDSEILSPLHQLIRYAHNDVMPPYEFTAFTPSIKLFLARNRISSLPPELFRLENITVLSLRNNELTELPPSIGRLRRLQELNIAGNNIALLPWELFPFFDCHGVHKRITVRPNPLIEAGICSQSFPLKTPFSASSQTLHLGDSDWEKMSYEAFKKHPLGLEPMDDSADLELRWRFGRLKRMHHLQNASRAGTKPHVCREELIHLISSAVRYFGPDGVPCHAANCEEMPWAPARAVNEPPPSFASYSAPSLFELALKTVQSNFQLDDLPCRLPPKVHIGLQKAHQGAHFGNQVCSTCGKSFVVPRAEWMEWWFHGSAQAGLTPESVLPFLRKACSWRCAQPSDIGEFRV
ncbi:leucine rich repeat domain [Lecanosticta acicola]|uniref:Leucine rich repeat domain n=1 Tax=Lecanosticta acicola TaxID=111012 RepID=A0AAI9EAP4_9PEZI|nr:leucine rich repeat domain [Lecanosticta acicola]